MQIINTKYNVRAHALGGQIMTEINYSQLLREVVTDYLERRLSRVQYLAQRRGILDRIDHEFNGEDEPNGWPEPDITQPVDSGTSQTNTLPNATDDGSEEHFD